MKGAVGSLAKVFTNTKTGLDEALNSCEDIRKDLRVQTGGMVRAEMECVL